MLDETFAEAVAHQPAPTLARLRGFSGHVILGQRLRPFSFWHAANLDFIKSPLAGHPGTHNFTSLYLAAKCCQLRYPQTIADGAGAPSRRINQKFTAIRFAYKFQSDSLFKAREQAKFSAYLTDYFSTGPVFAEREGGKPIKVPWYLYWVCLLVKYTRCTKERAWNSPVSETQWWITGLLQAEGAEIDILTAQDRSDLAKMGIAI